jgi:hypothetical protein
VDLCKLRGLPLASHPLVVALANAMMADFKARWLASIF